MGRIHREYMQGWRCSRSHRKRKCGANDNIGIWFEGGIWESIEGPKSK